MFTQLIISMVCLTTFNSHYSLNVYYRIYTLRDLICMFFFNLYVYIDSAKTQINMMALKYTLFIEQI